MKIIVTAFLWAIFVRLTTSTPADVPKFADCHIGVVAVAVVVFGLSVEDKTRRLSLLMLMLLSSFNLFGDDAILAIP